MSRTFVLDKNKKPLAPCTSARARILLSKRKASIFRTYPFTIILHDRVGGETQPLHYKIDQGSKTTGIALVSQNYRNKTLSFRAGINCAIVTNLFF